MPNLLRAKQVAKKRGCCVSKLYADIKNNKFPVGTPLAKNYVVWEESEVDEYIVSELNEARQRARSDV